MHLLGIYAEEMHDDHQILERRVDKFIASNLGWALHRRHVNLNLTRWEVPGEPVSIEEAVAARGDGLFEHCELGTRFGRPWGTTWFSVDAMVPDKMAGGRVEADFNFGFGSSTGFQSEALIWEQYGGAWRPLRGVHPRNHEIPVANPAQGGEPVNWLIEVASNPMLFGPSVNHDLLTADTAPIYSLREARLVEVNDEVWHLRLDMIALNRVYQGFDLQDPRKWELLRGLNAAIDAIDPRHVIETAGAARQVVAPLLLRHASPHTHRVSAIGHAHIDSAWLWPIRETIRKCARTFSNVLDLMDRYPEFRFGCSQAQQYDWMRIHYPTIFEGIKAAVERGQWVPLGGQWVEADANLPSGESLIRQQLHGQRFFEEHFGSICDGVWLPDVFGYPASLPQIFEHGGASWFLTQKLSWNRTNRFPHHTFRWEGIDGTTILTHFPPVETYNAEVDPGELRHLVRTFSDKGASQRSVMPFGFGDGGGGPTREMLEFYRRLRDLDGVPRMDIEAPSAFFEAVEQEYAEPPVWVGELYFEMHRGTYTSQARTKVGNRRCEFALIDAEHWRLAAFGPEPHAIDDRLRDLWREVLLLQFHDILPGSSIGWVHREAEEAHRRILAELAEIVDTAAADMAGSATAPRIVNPTTVATRRVILVPAREVSGGQSLGPETAMLVDLDERGIVELESLAPRHAVERIGNSFTNELVTLVWDQFGVVSIRDEQRDWEVFVAGDRPTLRRFHDLPNEFDAWDIEHFYRETPIDDPPRRSLTVAAEGPLLARLTVREEFDDSWVEMHWEVHADDPAVTVRCEVEWHQRHELLKFVLPVAVHTSTVTRDIQFGHCEMAIHENTSWDVARFEWCAHRFVDLTEYDHGVAVLNDGRYGYDARRRGAEDGRGVDFGVTVVRGADYPDLHADEGRHAFSLEILPHGGDFRRAGVVERALSLNALPRLLDAPAAPPEHWVRSATPGVICESRKVAEDGSGDVVVRFVERYGRAIQATFQLDRNVARVWRADGLERVTRAIEHSPDRVIALDLHPFEIVTLRLVRGERSS